MEKAIDAVRAGMSLYKAKKSLVYQSKHFQIKLMEGGKVQSLVELQHYLKKKPI